jgi:hypothetical protein
VTRSDDILREHFSTVLADAGSTGAVGEILSLLSQGSLEPDRFSDIVERHGLNRESWFWSQRLDLVLGYVSALIADGDLDADSLRSIANLKNCLGVTEGDFVTLRPAEVAAILAGELEQILEDDSIDEEEDLRQADLQAVFDLSYDQYLQLTRVEFERAMSWLVERRERAQANGDEDLFEVLELKIAALNPIYQLAVSQHRRLGGLY